MKAITKALSIAATLAVLATPVVAAPYGRAETPAIPPARGVSAATREMLSRHARGERRNARGEFTRRPTIASRLRFDRHVSNRLRIIKEMHGYAK
jgi:hypothetical protein